MEYVSKTNEKDKEAMTRYVHRIETLDGDIIEWETETPPTTPKEREAELERYYPHPKKASYLRFPCHYCKKLFYRFSPYRSANMSPDAHKTSRGDYMCGVCTIEALYKMNRRSDI